jgi:hypothetical protein
MHGPTSPNTDSLIWFFKAVYPKLRESLEPDVRVRAVGYVSPEAREALVAACPELDIVGMVRDLRQPLGEHRLMIVPTRYAAGIPQKVFDAATAGLPTVCSDLIARQMGWSDGVETLSASTEDGDAFAEKCAALYTDRRRWEAVRTASLASMHRYMAAGGIEHDLDAALARIEAVARGRGRSWSR